MSNVTLHDILNMPPECWSDDPVCVGQRHSTYKQASERLIEQEEFLSKLFPVIDKRYVKESDGDLIPLHAILENIFKRLEEEIDDLNMEIREIGARGEL